MNAPTKSITVVVPVYNSSDCLPEFMRQLTQELDALGANYDVVLVEDCSPDNSWEVLQELVPQYPRASIIQLMQNEGQARATLCGLAHAKGDIVITMDDDLQHRPDQLPKLIDALLSDPGLDCVFGCFAEKHHAGYRNLASKAIRQINARAFGLPKDVRSSGFRVMHRKVAAAMVAQKTANPAIPALLFGSTRRVKSVAVEHAPRFAGTSNYTLAKQFRLAFDNICTVTMLPLRAVSALGLLVCTLSGGLVLFYLTRYLLGRIGVPGWTTVVILLAFFSGVILLSLGVMGEYLVRVLREVRQAPMYVVRNKVGRLADSDRPGAKRGAESS